MTQCACGYAFKQAEEEHLSPAQQALADEKLYEDYLAVRASQATQLAQTAESAAQKAPQDDDKLSAARLAQENAERARLALHEQAQKVLQLTAVCRAEGAIAKRLQDAAAEPVTKPGVIATQAAQVAEAARALQAELAEMRAGGRAQKPRAGAQTKTAAGVPPSPALSASPVVPALAIGSPTATATPAAAATLTPTPPPATPVSVSVAAARTVRRYHHCPSCGDASSPVMIRCGCGQTLGPASLHRAGSASVDWQRRAELVAHIQRLESHIANTKRKREAAAAAARVQAKRKLAQKAEAVAQRLQAAKTKECFNCTAQVPLAATHCKCGFEFPQAAPTALMAEIPLDPAERERMSSLFKKS